MQPARSIRTALALPLAAAGVLLALWLLLAAAASFDRVHFGAEAPAPRTGGTAFTTSFHPFAAGSDILRKVRARGTHADGKGWLGRWASRVAASPAGCGRGCGSSAPRAGSSPSGPACSIRPA